MVRKVNHEELKKLIKLYFKTENKSEKKPSLFVWGRTGVGKSAVLEVSAREINEDLKDEKREFVLWNRSMPEQKEKIMNNPEKYFVFIDIRLNEYDSSDIKGLPQTQKSGRSIEFLVPTWALLLEKENSNGILFFDEINLAPNSIMSSCYKIIYDKIVNEGRINKNWLVMGAGNKSEDRAYTNEIPMPLLDRGGEVELLGADIDNWTNWAIENGIESRIIGFLNFKNSNLFKVDTDDEQKWTTYRGWERTSDLIKGKKDYKDIELLSSSSISEGIAKEFVAYCKIEEQLNLEEVIKNPERIKKITEISIKYFLITAIADKYREGKVNFEKIMDITNVFDEIKNVEFISLLWRFCYGYNEKFKEDFSKKSTDKIIEKYGKYF